MIDDCKKKLGLPQLWAALGLPEPEKVKSGANIKSPFREEKNASLWIKEHADGWFWEDYGSGGDMKGDEVDLIAAVRACSNSDAIQIYHELAGIGRGLAGDGGGKRRAKGLGRSRGVVKRKAKKVAPVPLASPVNDEVDRDAPPPVKRGSRVAKIYDYLNVDGQVVHQTIRYEPKDFRQRRPLGKGEVLADGEKRPFEQDGWVYSLSGIELLPYRLPQVMGADVGMPVFLCEGEKDADTLAGLGLIATTLPMGAGKWRDEFDKWFCGRWVVLVIDNDAAGESGAVKLGKALVQVVDRLSWLRCGELWADAPDKADVSDWVARSRGLGVPEERLAPALVDLAEEGEPPMDVLYDGIWEPGDRESIRVLQDVLADRIVRHRALLHAGGTFWQWRRRCVPNSGVWQRLKLQQMVPSWVREVLRREPETVGKIDDRMIRSVTNVMTTSRFADVDNFNNHDPLLINCRSGMLNSLTGECRPHDEQFYSTMQVPFSWNETAQCDQWLQWLEQMQPDAETRMQIQEMFGYCLVPAVNYHVFFFLFGDGGTGKSTCTDILTKLVGTDNTLAVQLEELDNAFMRKMLVDKQLYLCGELTSKSFRNIGLIKQISAGEPVYVDVKHGDGYTFRPRGRFVMTSNVVAATPDTSGGFERRFYQIDWKNVIPEELRDYQLDGKLSDELPGIFRWAIEGFRRLYERGRFTHTTASRSATEELMRHRSSVRMFLADKEWVVDNGARANGHLTMKDLYQHYDEWCEFYGVNAYYTEVSTFSKEAYRRMPDLKDRRIREEFDGERQVAIPGLQKSYPKGWNGS